MLFELSRMKRMFGFTVLIVKIEDSSACTTGEKKQCRKRQRIKTATPGRFTFFISILLDALEITDE
jgi:hypothetical protein